MTEDLTLAQWLSEYEDEIKQMVEFSKAALPDDPGKMQLELSRAQQEIGRAGALLADAESYLVQAEAAATIEIRKKYSDFTADDRKAMVKGSIRNVTHLCATLRVVVSAIKNKSFALMNLNRTQG